MEKELRHTKDILQKISDQLHVFIRENFPDGWILISQILGKFILLALIVYAIDLLLKFLINALFNLFVSEEKYPLLISLHKSRITNSVAHLFALLFGSYALHSVFWRHPKSFDFLETIIDLMVVFVIAGMAFRFLKAIEYYYLYKKDYYRIVALRAISQSVRIFGIFIFSVIAISVIFKISSATILGSLGAITAVLVLVFRDTILGFVTGIHVATSRNLKAGDWIGIPKYNLEGTIEDINLLTTKILNFDKTISTIPTYDLLSTEIKNLQVMSETNTRRIKRSIVFNINSFQFIDDGFLDKLKKINLVRDYLVKKQAEIKGKKSGMDNDGYIINGEQLTNIGVFRIYALNYLKQNPNIDQNGTLMVRQLEITPNGMPLEIYCFTNDSIWENYEEIQADIFDHLLVAAKEFDLEVMQISLKAK